MLNKCALAVLSIALATVAGQAMAKSNVEMTMVAEKEVKVDDNGQVVIKRVPAATVDAGDVLVYTIHYKNTGDEKATGVRARDDIPAGLVYVDNSASGANSKITFSIDTGKDKVYKDADSLLVNKSVDGIPKEVKAQPSEYTSIQWVISEVAPGGSGDLSFRAKAQP